LLLAVMAVASPEQTSTPLPGFVAANRSYSYETVVQRPDGNCYGTTSQGHDFTGSACINGHFYRATAEGVVFAFVTIFSITPATVPAGGKGGWIRHDYNRPAS